MSTMSGAVYPGSDLAAQIEIVIRAIEGGMFDAEIDDWYRGPIFISHEAGARFNARAAELLGGGAYVAWHSYGAVAHARQKRAGVLGSSR